MELLAHIAPLDEAVKKFGARSIVASKARTAEWEKVALDLRDRAFFSARVDRARFLRTAQEKLKDAISQRREQVAHGEAIVDRSSFIGDLRKLALREGLSDGTGGLTDVASRTRLGLIYDMQLRMAQGYAQRKMDLDPDVLDAFPAQELVREEERNVPRDWEARWTARGGELIAGRMVALKTDPIWTKISRFGTPWPPFDFGSGMGLNDVSRDEAEQLGLISPGAPVAAEDEYFNKELAASAENVDVDFLKASFGDQVRIKDGKAEWVGNLIGDLFDQVAPIWESGGKFDTKEFRGRAVDFGRATPTAVEKTSGMADLAGARMQLRPDNIFHMLKSHGAEKNKAQMSLTKDDVELLPFVWRDPDAVEAGDKPRSLVFKKTIGGTTYLVAWDEMHNRTYQANSMWVKK
ncbi:MAG: hypothetical protein M5U15_13710 [Kiritimatiellae bacterium]|nr:hypothetical protein [Kiritimatiellia bacterium]